METNRTEDFPSHWKATLLGEAFWKDAERFNQPINDSIEASKLLLLLAYTCPITATFVLTMNAHVLST
jgi:hypothetical protein